VGVATACPALNTCICCRMQIYNPQNRANNCDKHMDAKSIYMWLCWGVFMCVCVG